MRRKRLIHLALAHNALNIAPNNDLSMLHKTISVFPRNKPQFSRPPNGAMVMVIANVFDFRRESIFSFFILQFLEIRNSSTEAKGGDQLRRHHASGQQSAEPSLYREKDRAYAFRKDM